MPASPDFTTLARAIRHAVWCLESGRPQVVRDLLYRTLPCPPQEHAIDHPLHLKRHQNRAYAAASSAPRRA
jgi:hypothetical protein